MSRTSRVTSRLRNVANIAGNLTNVTNSVNNIVNGGGIKYFHANSTLADSTATGTNAVSIGGAATASAANSVALGSNSVANRANAVSVGAVGTERQIINVANGTSGTDAINLSQLQAMGATIGTSGVVTNAFVSYDDTSKTKVTFGGVGALKPVTLTNVAAGVANTDAVNMAQLKQMGATIDSNGNVSGSFVAYDNTSMSSITLKGTSGTKISDVAAGTLSAGSMDAVNGSQLYSTNQNVAAVSANVANMAGNLTNVTNSVNNIVNGGGIKYFHVNSTLADSLATGTNAIAIGGNATASAANSVALGANSLANRANAVSVGGVGTERQIINVANATQSTDAVNLSQLTAMGATFNSSGVVSNAFVAYDSTTKSSVTLGGVGASSPVLLTNLAAGQVTSSSRDAINGSQLYNTANSVAAALGGNQTVGTDGTLSSPSYVINGQTSQSVGDALSQLDGEVQNVTSGAALTQKYIAVKSIVSLPLRLGPNPSRSAAIRTPAGSAATAIGSAARSTYANATALGANAVTYEANTVSVGSRSVQNRITNLANGINLTDAVTVAQLNAMQASMSKQSGERLRATLLGATVPVTSYIAVSSNVDGGMPTATSNAQNAMAIGPSAQANGIGSLAIGAGTGAGSDGSTAVGSAAAALAANTTVIGTNASTGSNAIGAVSIGYHADSEGVNTLSFGTDANANGDSSVALGYASFTGTGRDEFDGDRRKRYGDRGELGGARYELDGDACGYGLGGQQFATTSDHQRRSRYAGYRRGEPGADEHRHCQRGRRRCGERRCL